MTIVERLVVAGFSLFAAVTTCVAIAGAVFYVVSDALTFEFWRIFVYWTAGFVVLMTAGGFILGPRHAAEIWGAVWGTMDPHRSRVNPRFFFVVVAVFILVAMVAKVIS